MPMSLQHAPIAEALRGSPIPALRHVHVDETDTTVILSGRVSSYYHKQLAQETVLPLCQPRQLVNRVEVVRKA
jgi:hypothetical protein